MLNRARLENTLSSRGREAGRGDAAGGHAVGLRSRQLRRLARRDFSHRRCEPAPEHLPSVRTVFIPPRRLVVRQTRPLAPKVRARFPHSPFTSVTGAPLLFSATESRRRPAAPPANRPEFSGVLARRSDGLGPRCRDPRDFVAPCPRHAGPDAALPRSTRRARPTSHRRKRSKASVNVVSFTFTAARPLTRTR